MDGVDLNLKIIYLDVENNNDVCVEELVRKELGVKGIDTVRLNPNGVFGRGVPDLMSVDRSVFFEVKSESDSLRVSQIEWILNNSDKKVFVVVARKVKDVVNKKVSRVKKEFFLLKEGLKNGGVVNFWEFDFCFCEEDWVELSDLIDVELAKGSMCCVGTFKWCFL